MKKTILFGAMIFGSLAFAQKTPILGGDSDAHGCKGSAGYTYSQIKNDCVRLFEEKIQLDEVKPKNGSKSMTAVIFSKDMKKAEVFLPDMKKSLILTKQAKTNTWKNGSYSLLTLKKGYELRKGKEVIFK
ncbi:hypothetical protein [Chryseobacterium daeguense]|uniref:hypothetical protein n=1 Tax=Chryseobacterium daeguense TaxID=412438 RepID=UPI0004013BF4|nr:hypothetical protein [Chryseobacterium daeguense]